MNQLNRSGSKQGLLKKQVETFGLRKVSRPPNPNPLALLYHPKSGRLFDLLLAKPLRQIFHFDCG